MSAADPSGSMHRLPTDTADGMLLVISGPSGVGKTTITRAVERAVPGAVFSVSCTTRPKTHADADGVDYTFLSPEEFERRERAGDFLESATYAANRYGTPKGPVEAHLSRGRLMILEIDVAGAKQVKSRMPEAFGLFILPPSEEVLLERLRGRKREPEEVIQRRFKLAQQEIAEARRCGVYDLFLVNRVLEEAINEAVRAVHEERERRRAARGAR